MASKSYWDKLGLRRLRLYPTGCVRKVTQLGSWKGKRVGRWYVSARLVAYAAAEALLARLYWLAGPDWVRSANLTGALWDPALRFYEEKAATPGDLMRPSDWDELNRRQCRLLRKWGIFKSWRL